MKRYGTVHALSGVSLEIHPGEIPGVIGVQHVLSFITRLKSEGIACIFVTHNLHDVHAVADRFVVMRQGEIVANKRKDEVSVEDLIDLQLVDQRSN